MTKLNYDNAAALINAFKQGAKFKIIGAHNADNNGAVDEMEPSFDGMVRALTRGGTGLSFKADGMPAPHLTNTLRLVRDESLGFERTTVTVGDSVFGWTPAKKAATMAPPAPAVEKPLLQRMLDGESFHCPKTRELVQEIAFQSGALAVKFKAEGAYDSITRTSHNYRHDGTHKHDPARSLVAGPVPPKVPVVPTFTRKDLQAGNVSAGVYKPADGRDIRVVVFGPYLGARTALFVGLIYATPEIPHDCLWVKADEKPSVALARVE